MELIKLVNYSIESPREGSCLEEVDFSLNRGERVSVIANVRHDVRLFMRGLASLVYPRHGSFLFKPLMILKYSCQKMILDGTRQDCSPWSNRCLSFCTCSKDSSSGYFSRLSFLNAPGFLIGTRVKGSCSSLVNFNN